MRAAAITSLGRAKHPPALETSATVRERGAVGAVLLTIRAAGAQVIAIGNFVADGGLGASLIRKPTNPTAEELRTLLALQLALATAIAVVVLVVGSRAGTVGGV